eukprot:TRINITY_DN4084_c0_g1_i1.p1 TRINITY_DN4084_c0_g1~~TRINITY_DN4084_c0_g1_i1.p1  ORF type:complete len:150 (-),score=19.28 TRINITY_DN4084_c0_g1_i1:521-970(-)
MDCSRCDHSKPISEFPSFVNPNCKHRPTTCTRCLLSYTKGVANCPECYGPFDEEILSLIQSSFSSLLWEERLLEKENELLIAGKIVIVQLSGEYFEVDFVPDMNCAQLKQRVYEKTRIDPKNQRLLFQGEEIPIVHQTKQASTPYTILA